MSPSATSVVTRSWLNSSSMTDSPPVQVDGDFSKDRLDAEFVTTEVDRVTRGYCGSHELAAAGLPIGEYPLSEVLARRDDEGCADEA